MFETLDFIIIGIIFFISFLFAMLGKRIFFSYSFPKNEVNSFLKSKDLFFKSFREISLNDIPNNAFFESQSLLYNIFLFKIVYFEVKAENSQKSNVETIYVKFYKAGMGLILKDKILFS